MSQGWTQASANEKSFNPKQNSKTESLVALQKLLQGLLLARLTDCEGSDLWHRKLQSQSQQTRSEAHNAAHGDLEGLEGDPRAAMTRLPSVSKPQKVQITYSNDKKMVEIFGIAQVLGTRL